MKTLNCFLGIDSGTQSTKAVLVTESGRVVGRGSAPHAMIEGLAVGHAEQDPAVWIDAMIAACKAALASAPAGIHVQGVGVSGQQHGFVPLDAAGRVIRPAKLWCDTSTAAQVEKIYAAMGGEAGYVREIGNALAVGFTASKILWLKENEPENYVRLDCVLLPHDYLNFWLSGEKSMEPGDASGTGLMSIEDRTWSSGVINAIDPDLAGKLPAIRPSDAPCGRLSKHAAEALNLEPGIVVASGGGDNMMGAIGTGNVAPGVATVSLGTSGTIYSFCGEARFDPAHEIATFCSSTGGWLPLLCTMNVTASTNMVAGLFGLNLEQFNAAAASVPAGSDGLLFLPYLSGERTPNVPDGTGVWFGVRPTVSTPAHHARAAMEGATLGLGYGWQRLKTMGLDFSEVRLTGGGSRSALWRQIVADVLDCPVVNTTEPEGAALGAALQAYWIFRQDSGGEVPLSELARVWITLDETTRCHPNPTAASTYRELQEMHDSLSQSLRGPFAKHRGWLNGNLSL